MTQFLVIAGALAAFGILVWLLMRVARRLGREEERTDRSEEAERIKDEQIKIASRRPRSVGELLRLMRGKRS
jgi:flagellar biogenesis protein FliO